LIFSIISWAIMINKLRIFRKVEKETRRFLTTFRKSKSLSEAYIACGLLHRTPLHNMLVAGFKETEQFSKKDEVIPVEKRAEVVKMTLDRVGAEEISRLERNVVFLATTGNISPFFGLLGTVWGVMDSFASIGIRGTASLAVVAPGIAQALIATIFGLAVAIPAVIGYKGIAQALIATIFGLAVAIPAVIGYNYFNNRLKFVATDIDNFSLEFLTTAKKEGIL